MAQDGSGRSWGTIALIVLGVLLLAPGACGLLFAGGTWIDHLARGTVRMGDYEEIVWILAQPGVMLGCLGLFVIAKASGRPGFIKAARFAGWFALVFTLAVSALVTWSTMLRGRGMDEGLSLAGIFLVAFLIGGLPGLLGLRNQQTPGQGDNAS